MQTEADPAMTAPPSPMRVPAYTLLAAALTCSVMLCGAWEMYQAGSMLTLDTVPHESQDFRQGRTTGAIEKQLDQKIPARKSLIAFANVLRYLVNHSAGEQVRLGRQDWLFLNEELQFHKDAVANLKARIELLHAVSRALAREDVTLVVALVPDKARIEAAYLASGQVPDYNRSRYQVAVDGLRAQGVTVVDLQTPLALAAKQAPVYYRSDTHWNQTGAQLAARTIASEIRSLNLDMEPTAFRSETNSVATERVGDLLFLMGLDRVPNALRPQPDRERSTLTRQASPETSGGLFGDASVPVVLTGTSYSLRGNFHGFLQEALGVKILNAAKDGAGFLQATTQYLQDESFRSSKPRVLLWEVPERFLGTPLGEESQWLESVGLTSASHPAGGKQSGP